MWFRSGAGLLCCLIAATSSHATPTDDNALWPLLERLQGDVQQLLTVTPSEAVPDTLGPGCADPAPHDYHALAFEAEANKEARDLGLELRGGYILDDARGRSVGQSAYLELSWDLLEEGRRENLIRARSLQHSAHLARLEADRARLDDQYACRRETRVRQMRQLRSSLLARRGELLRPLVQAVRRGYLTGYRHLDGLLEVEGELAVTEHELRGLRGLRVDGRPPRNPPHPAAMDLYLPAILKAIERDPLPALSAALERARLSQSSRFRDQNKLRVFVRADADRLSDDLDSGGMAAGVRFRLPLTKPGDRDLQLRLLAADADYQRQLHTRLRRTREAYRELREQAERVQRQQYRVLRANERVRRSLTDRRLYPAEADLVAAVSRTQDLIDAAIEQVRAEEELQRRLVKVMQRAELPLIPAYLKPLGEADFNYRGRSGERAIYLWSGDIDRHAPAVLVAFLKAKGIRQVMLSTGRRLDTARRAAFVREATHAGIGIEHLFGNNSWVEPDNHAKAVSRIRRTAPEGVIHLDVEPQALADFKQRQDDYLDQFDALTRAVRAALKPEQSLHLSLPVWWPADRYAVLARDADRLVLMAYGQPAADRIARRLQPILALVPAERLALALRPADFDNEWQLEQAIEKLRALTGIQRFALHGVDAYLGMAGKQP